ncbi:MAG: M64 family metallopeptidase [Candidatus Aenigmatarchaeota archaeon]
MKSIDVVQNSSQTINKTIDCNKSTHCQLNWNFNFENPGNYTFWGYLTGSEPTGRNEVSSTYPKNIKIEVNDLRLELHDAKIVNGSLLIKYSKNFKKCVEVTRIHKENLKLNYLICEEGKNKTIGKSLEKFDAKENDLVRLCHIEFTDLCSKVLPIKKVGSAVDNESPQIKDISVNPEKPTTVNQVRIHTTIKDSHSAIDKCNISLDSRGFSPLKTEDRKFDTKEEVIYKNLGKLPEGEHKITVKCSDSSKNNATKSRSFFVKTPTCNETDNGKDPKDAGHIIYGNEKYRDFCQNNRLTEFYCDGEYKTHVYDCNQYCEQEFGSNFKGDCSSGSKGGFCKCENKRCNKIEVNGDSSKKIDLVFVAADYPKDSNFKKDVLKHLDFNKEYNGIFSFKPFSERRDKFNFYYVNAGKDYDCGQMCEYSEILKDASYCPYDQIIVLVAKSNGGGYAYTGKGFAVSRSWDALEGDEFWKYWSLTTAHEFGHSFGGLEDEYFNKRPTSETQGPNCDIKGCPSWCNNSNIPDPNLCYGKENKSICEEVDIPFTSKDCKWEKGNPPYYSGFCAPNFDTSKNFGQNCEENVGCYWNCKGGNGFKPAQKSVMTGNKNGYNEVSRKFMVNVMQCCYPNSREQFNKEKCTQWANKNTTKYNLKWAPEECTTYGGQ